MDSIIGLPLLEIEASLFDLRIWFTQRGLTTLADISHWDELGNWVEWSLPKVPDHLLPY